MVADNIFLPPNLPLSLMPSVSKRCVSQHEKQVLGSRLDEIEDKFHDQIDLSQVEELESDIDKSIALSLLAPNISESLKPRAIKIARGIRNTNHSVSATISLLPYIAEYERHIICNELLDNIRGMDNSFHRSSALISILEYIPSELISKVSDLFRTLDREDQMDVHNAYASDRILLTKLPLFEDVSISPPLLQITSALNSEPNIVTIDSHAEINILHIQDAIYRHTNIQFPDQCIIAQPVPLSIQLTVEVNSLSRSSEQIIVPFQGDDAVDLRVFVSADSFYVEPRQCEMRVPVFEDSETVTFTLTPHKLGEQDIEIELYHYTSRIGYAVIDTSVVEAV